MSSSGQLVVIQWCLLTQLFVCKFSGSCTYYTPVVKCQEESSGQIMPDHLQLVSYQSCVCH